MPLEWGGICSGAGPHKEVPIRQVRLKLSRDEARGFRETPLGFRGWSRSRQGRSGGVAGPWQLPPDWPEPDLTPLCLQQINQDLNIQLLKDGYRLDEIPDDEDLDLIPPKSVNPTCMCCQATSSTACHIQ